MESAMNVRMKEPSDALTKSGENVKAQPPRGEDRARTQDFVERLAAAPFRQQLRNAAGHLFNDLNKDRPIKALKLDFAGNHKITN
jgi:hypothetical protein